MKEAVIAGKGTNTTLLRTRNWLLHTTTKCMFLHKITNRLLHMQWVGLIMRALFFNTILKKLHYITTIPIITSYIISTRTHCTVPYQSQVWPNTSKHPSKVLLFLNLLPYYNHLRVLKSANDRMSSLSFKFKNKWNPCFHLLSTQMIWIHNAALL